MINVHVYTDKILWDFQGFMKKKTIFYRFVDVNQINPPHPNSLVHICLPGVSG